MGRGVTGIKLHGIGGRGSREPGCAFAILHFSKRGQQNYRLGVLSKGVSNDFIGLFYLLLSEKYLRQTRSQSGVVLFLLKLRLIEIGGMIVAAMKESLIRFGRCVSRCDFAADRQRGMASDASHKNERNY